MSDLRTAVAAVPEWFHSLDLGDGIVTPGHKSSEVLAGEWEALALPDLRGRSVLDIGAWDGFFSFAAERAGAARVVALDHYVWQMDLPARWRYLAECRARGEPPAPFEDVPALWHPETLPGKQGFDLARTVFGSHVQAVVGDVATMDLAPLGTFDVVLCLGVLYHVRAPLPLLERVRRLTRELAVIESAAVHLPGVGDRAVCEFFPTNELAGDPGNWWCPNAAALLGLCRAAGFRTVALRQGPPTDAGAPCYYRAIVHARG